MNSFSVGDLVIRNTDKRWYNGSLSVLDMDYDGSFTTCIHCLTQVFAVVLEESSGDRIKIFTSSGVCGWVRRGGFVRA